jgi:hypothetical protein
MPGWIGDPGNGNLPGAAASASAATTGARARITAGPKRRIKKEEEGVRSLFLLYYGSLFCQHRQTLT